MAKLFASVREETAPALRAKLVASQWKWLAQRDTSCRTGLAACLAAAMSARQDALDALDARVTKDDPQLTDITAYAMSGTWRVMGYRVPFQTARKVSDDSLPDYLPRTGATFTVHPGRLCTTQTDCWQFGLNPTTVGDLAQTYSTFKELALPKTTLAFIVSSRNEYPYNLVVLPNRDLLANFGLCDPNAQNCTAAYQIWHPASADAAINKLAIP